MSTLIISNEEAFLKYVNSVIVSGEEPRELKFEGWPSINLDIKGERYHSSLPTKLMEGLVSFQNEIDKAYALLSYRSANRQKLTNDDKEKLELVFTIKEGSTGASVDLGGWINGIINKLDVVFEDMTGKQKTGLIALLILSVVGSYTAIDFKQSTSKAEVELAKEETAQKAEQERTLQIESLTDSNEKTVQVLRDILLEKAVEESPRRAKDVVKIVNEGYKEVIKSVQDADQISIGDTTYSNSEIKRISEKPQVVKNVDQQKGDFYIDAIKKKESYLIVGVSSKADDASFNIKVDTSFLKPEENNALYDAFRDGEAITLDYQANLQNGEILNARLIKVVLEETLAEEKDTTSTSYDS